MRANATHVKCHQCGQYGHLKRHCQENKNTVLQQDDDTKRKNRGRKSKYCSHHGKCGHTTEQCRVLNTGGHWGQVTGHCSTLRNVPKTGPCPHLARCQVAQGGHARLRNLRQCHIPDLAARHLAQPPCNLRQCHIPDLAGTTQLQPGYTTSVMSEFEVTGTPVATRVASSTQGSRVSQHDQDVWFDFQLRREYACSVL